MRILLILLVLVGCKSYNHKIPFKVGDVIKSKLSDSKYIVQIVDKHDSLSQTLLVIDSNGDKKWRS